jgi:large subunit ribosomal protein L10
MPSQHILQKKISEVQEVAQLITKYKAIGIASLQKVRAAQLQEFKKNLADKVFMRVIQNTLMKRAIGSHRKKSGLKKLIEHLEGANIYLFTDLDPFKLALLLEKGKVMTTAKSGDIAAFDVVVPAGNTGQPPGPVISQLNAVGLPTRIESGSVWITKNTLVVKKSEVISERLAGTLSKLGIKPVEAGLVMKVAYDGGLIITEEQLQIDLDETKQSIESAHADAFALSLSVAYPTLENVEMLLQIAYQEAYTLGVNAAIATKETIGDLIRKAHVEMLSLSSRLPTLQEKAASSEEVKKAKISE